jgi:hypothetical protein
MNIDEGSTCTPEIKQIYIDIEKFNYFGEQTANWHFICGEEEVIFSPKELFQLIKKLRGFF